MALQSRISWRWLIRATCLSLLALCLGLWALSCFRSVSIMHSGDSVISVGVSGSYVVSHRFSPILSSVDIPPGWRFSCRSLPPVDWRLLVLPTKISTSVGPMAGQLTWHIAIPLWYPTLLLTGICLLAWRRTRPKARRGFLVEPRATGGSAPDPPVPG